MLDLLFYCVKCCDCTDKMMWKPSTGCFAPLGDSEPWRAPAVHKHRSVFSPFHSKFMLMVWTSHQVRFFFFFKIMLLEIAGKKNINSALTGAQITCGCVLLGVEAAVSLSQKA